MNKVKKGWLIICGLLLILIILNPTYSNFKEFIGISGTRTNYLQKKSNFLFFSIYHNDIGNRKYIGFLKNFVEISNVGLKAGEHRIYYDTTAKQVVDSSMKAIDDSSQILKGREYLIQLYNSVSKTYDVGTIKNFLIKIQEPKLRKNFYKAASKNYNLGTWEEFDYKIDSLFESATLKSSLIINNKKPSFIRLYNLMKEAGLYSASFEDFQKEYNNVEAIDGLYYKLHKSELYTKSKEDFYIQYFN
jgi:hypothetical protein